MTTSVLLPAKFNANIYTYRMILSQKLTELVMFRVNCETLDCNKLDIIFCDELLQKTHYKFIEVKKMIEIEEIDNYRFGMPIDETILTSLL